VCVCVCVCVCVYSVNPPPQWRGRYGIVYVLLCTSSEGNEGKKIRLTSFIETSKTVSNMLSYSLGNALKDTPIIKDVLRTIINMPLERKTVQHSVDIASGVVKGMVR
jgi:predicted mannosyl-3-phosphoglycerate phosphatase (HAD superfamily)